jgi:hypothetical protein
LYQKFGERLADNEVGRLIIVSVSATLVWLTDNLNGANIQERNVLHPVARIAVNAATDEFRILKGNQYEHHIHEQFTKHDS